MVFVAVSAHVLFFGAHVEEVVVLATSEGVVGVLTDDGFVFLGGLDVPEVVVGYGGEDFVFGVSAQTVLVSVLHVLNVIVLLTLTKHSELL